MPTKPTLANANTTNSYAKIDWKNGQPFSTVFDDVYFNSDDGLAETHHVFIQNNHLVQRFQHLKNACFTIIETGFGTGLNFLSTWKTWREHAPADVLKNSTLHFISCEKYPVTQQDLATSLQLFPSLNDLSEQLIKQYAPLKNSQTMIFEQGNITLTLLIGDATEQLAMLQAKADAWFLDGFSPSKNPDMWSNALFMQMAALSTHQSTLATFTSAGMVKRGLKAAGFTVHKCSGFGKKREMLIGGFNGDINLLSTTAIATHYE